MFNIQCFYLDEKLSSEEEFFVLDSLVSRQVIKDKHHATFEYTRVPSVFPVIKPEVNVDSTQLIKLLRKHLQKAGIGNINAQPLWLMPREIRWGVIFQISFFEETGFFPYVIQRWERYEDGTVGRGNIRMIDGHGMMGFKDDHD